MINPSSLRNKILSVLPESLANDIGDNIDSAIQTHFEQMNLVSRQEFDIQRKVLSKTRAKLNELEEALSELQNK